MDSIREGLRVCSACRAEREAALNSSEPQKRIRRGEEGLVVRYRRWVRDRRLKGRLSKGFILMVAVVVLVLV